MSQQLQRSLGLTALTLIAVGGCIGSGIFKSPSAVADYLRDPTLILAVWGLGGLIALSGALTLAETGSMFPKAGGIYVYIKEAFGELTAFLYGWTILAVSNTGSIAALVITFAHYVGFIIPIGDRGELLLSITAIVVVTFANLFGARAGGTLAGVFTSLKLMGIIVIILAGLFMAGIPMFENVSEIASVGAKDKGPISAFGLALISVLWAYGGWQHASMLSGEAKNPSRNIPLAMVLGAFIVTVVYMLTNVAYLQMLPIDQMAATKTVAADAMSQKFSWGGNFVAALIAISTFGTASIYCLSAPRIYFAMANDGLFFKSMAQLHPKYQVPVNAILIQSAWAIVLLLLWGTFEDLITYVEFIDYIFFMLAGISMLILRRKMPNAERPYRTWGYPVVPLFFVLVIGWFISNTLIEKPLESLAGVAVLLVGVPLFYLFKRQQKP